MRLSDGIIYVYVGLYMFGRVHLIICCLFFFFLNPFSPPFFFLFVVVVIPLSFLSLSFSVFKEVDLYMYHERGEEGR